MQWCGRCCQRYQKTRWLCVHAAAYSFNQFILHDASVVLVDVALLPILEGKKNTKRRPAINTHAHLMNGRFCSLSAEVQDSPQGFQRSATGRCGGGWSGSSLWTGCGQTCACWTPTWRHPGEMPQPIKFWAFKLHPYFFDERLVVYGAGINYAAGYLALCLQPCAVFISFSTDWPLCGRCGRKPCRGPRCERWRARSLWGPSAGRWPSPGKYWTRREHSTRPWEPEHDVSSSSWNDQFPTISVP